MRSHNVYMAVICACLSLLSAHFAMAQAGPSPLACAITRQGVNYHIKCDVLRGMVQVKNVRINDGQCMTMQDYYEQHSRQLTRLKRMLNGDMSDFEFRKTYQAGEHFMIYVMSCDVHRYSLETNTGEWGWYATGD